jgi:hypothetical protein
LATAGNLDDLFNTIDLALAMAFRIESGPLDLILRRVSKHVLIRLRLFRTSDHTRLYGNRMPQLAASTKSVAPLREIPMPMQGSTTCDPIYFLFTGLIVGVRFRPRSIARPAIKNRHEALCVIPD